MSFSEEVQVQIDRIRDAFAELQQLVDGSWCGLSLGPVDGNTDRDEAWFDGLYFSHDDGDVLVYDGNVYPEDPEFLVKALLTRDVWGGDR